MKMTFRAYVAEFVGVFLIVFIGGAVCVSFPVDDNLLRVDPWTRVMVALAEGGALAVVLPITFRESPGCLNPAVTLAFWVCKRLDNRQTAILVGLQLLGSVIAGLAIRAIYFNEEAAIYFATPHIGRPLLDEGGQITLSSQAAAFAIEALLTFFFTFAVFGFLIDRRAKRFDGMAVGVAKGVIVLVGYGVTGGAVNPARWFGPAIWQLTVASLRLREPLYDHFAYWAAPIVGALGAGMLYTTYILPPDQANGVRR